MKLVLLPRPIPVESADDSQAALEGAKTTRRKTRRPRRQDVTPIAQAFGYDSPGLTPARRRRPRERATPGVPGLKQVESLIDPREWNWVFRYTNPETGKRASESYGASSRLPYMEAVARAQRDRETVRRGRNPGAAKMKLDVL